MKITKSGYEVFNHNPDDEKIAGSQGYCSRCYHTYWKKEIVVTQGKGFIHKDCLVALADSTPRTLNPGVASVIGELDKSILKRKAKKAILSNLEKQ